MRVTEFKPSLLCCHVTAVVLFLRPRSCSRYYPTQFLEDAMLTLSCKVSSCKTPHAGMYLHVFPLCSVNSLHLHVVNLARQGPALRHHAHKNMPLAAVLNAFL